MQPLRHFLLAVQFFSRIPVNGRLAAWVGWSPAMQRASAGHLPGVGWLVGLWAALLLGASLWLLPTTSWTPLVAATLSTAGTLWLTGGFHEDGLADVADGLGGFVPPERALEIMKDSRMGAYGVMALIMALLTKLGLIALLLTTMEPFWGPVPVLILLVCCHVLSRFAPLVLMHTLPHVGLAATSKTLHVAGQPLDWRGLLSHGDARKFLEANTVSPRVKIIDLSQDYRLKSNSMYQGQKFIYGLPELNRDTIKSAQYLANPGCFATNIQLALLPLAAHNLLPGQVHVTATTGSTGAGQKPGATSHFSWRSGNLSAYKSFEHQHLQEISESLNQLQNGFLEDSDCPLMDRAAKRINFVPLRGAFPRGIFSSIYVDSDLTEEEAYTYYEDYYQDHPFTVVSRVNIDLKQVVNTNKSILYLEKHGDKLLVLNATDNLLKGASGQAVQNMNLMFGLSERTGLNLKSVGF